MDLSKVTDEDLAAYQSGRMGDISDDGLAKMSQPAPVVKPAPSTNPVDIRGQKIDSYLSETDKMLGLTPGTSARQINQESRFDDAAFNEGSGASGLAQVIEKTRASLSNRVGRKLDSHNTDDALFMHRELMKENMARFGNESDALRAYNSGWTPANWDNEETNGYIDIIMGSSPDSNSAPLPTQSKGGGKNQALSLYSPVPESMTEASLNTNQDFLAAAEQMYMFRENRRFNGTDDDLADWGKEYIWDFSNNSLAMGTNAVAVINSDSQDVKDSMLYMMDAFDNTDISAAGAWRSTKAVLWDPLTLPVLASLGLSTVAKVVTQQAALLGVRGALLKAAGRTGVIAGLETGIIGGAQNSTRQYIEVNAGAKDEFSNTELATSVGVSAVLGLTIGTAGDVVAQRLAPGAARKLGELRQWLKPTKGSQAVAEGVGNTAPVQLSPSTGVAMTPDEVVSATLIRGGATPPVPARPAIPEVVAVEGVDAVPAVPAVKAKPAVPAQSARAARPAQEALPAREATKAVKAVDAKPAVEAVPAKEAVPAVPAKPAVISVKRVDAVEASPMVPATATTPEIPAVKAVDAVEAVRGVPARPAKPAKPAVPAKPAKPAVPAVKAVKAQPAREAVPARPARPARAAQPAQPAIKAEPAVKAVKAVKAVEAQAAQPARAAQPAKAAPEGSPPATPFPTGRPSADLPPDLAGAKPRWKTSHVVFENDIDKALYITHNAVPSVRDNSYRNFLREHGFTEAQIASEGAALLSRMKGIGDKVPVGEPLVVPKGVKSKWVNPNAVEPKDLPDTSSGNRRQKGRQWPDDLPPVVDADPENLARLVVPDSGTGLRSTPRSNETSEANGRIIERQLMEWSNRELAGVLEAERIAPHTMEDFATINLGIKLYANRITAELAEALGKLRTQKLSINEYAETLQLTLDLEERLIPLQATAEAKGSATGSLLQQQRIGLDVVPSIKVLMEEDKLTRIEASLLFERLHANAAQADVIKQAMIPHDVEIAKANLAGDTVEVLRLQAVKRMEREALIEQNLPNMGELLQPSERINPVGEVIPRNNRLINKLVEYAVANVLSPMSVAINIATSLPKTLTAPLVYALVGDPFARATRIRMAGAYSSMMAMQGQALRMSLDTWKYEQLIATRDSSKLLDGPMANTGRFGGLIRTIPRVMATMDEYLTNMNYAAFIGGRAREKASIEAIEQGMTKTAAKAHMKAAQAQALKDGYDSSNAEVLLQPIVNKGVNRGLRGADLSEWVLEEAQGKHALAPAIEGEALNMARDVMYQRKWSKTNVYSKGAASYEAWVSDYPSLRLILGQLFFRTPIRVVEEGLRLTPGLQLMMPNFAKDLAGGNGEGRQLRAQAEMLLSTAVAGYALTQYAQGNIVGSGGRDSYKQQRLSEDLGAKGAYTISGNENNTWVYRAADPISIPIKILINGMELAEKLHIRQTQGDAPEQSQIDQITAYMFVGIQAVTMAVKDANLMAGFSAAIDIGAMALDPENSDSKSLRYINDRLNWIWPSTFTKMAKMNDPTIKDPQDFSQILQQRLESMWVDTTGIKTSKSYDIFGNVRLVKDTGRVFNMFSTASPEERTEGLTADEVFAGKELTQLSKVTGAIFATPTKFAETGDLDLRTILTADGKETLYDRWSYHYHKSNVARDVAALLRTPLPDGTFKNKGPMVSEVRKVLAMYREAAFYKMRETEQVVIDKHEKEINDSAKAKAGISGLDWFN